MTVTTQIKSRERKQVTKTTNRPIKNLVVQYQVEQSEEEKGIKTTFLKKVIQYRIQREMKKWIPSS
jgi:hypothetical protein